MLKNQIRQKREGREKEAHSFRVLGIVWIFLGIIHPIFFILGIIFLTRSANMHRDLEKEGMDTTRLIEKNNRITKLFCSECGTRIEPEDFFCFTCGRRVN